MSHSGQEALAAATPASTTSGSIIITTHATDQLQSARPKMTMPQVVVAVTANANGDSLLTLPAGQPQVAQGPKMERSCRQCRRCQTDGDDSGSPGNGRGGQSPNVELMLATFGTRRWSSTAMSAPAATAAAAAAPARLYVDALNFGGQFVSRDHWKLSEITDNVGLFVGAAKRSSIELKVFIDETIRTGDALQKWQRRREREVRTGRRNVPHGMSELVGDAFRQAGVDVHYSEELDNDDTLASFAQADGAAILSADRDFFDYRDSTFDVYDDFNVTASRALELRPARAKGPQRNCKALVLDRYPQTKTTPQRVHAGTTVYRRGAPSGLVRLAGNPHITVRPLRQALYHDVGIRSPVIEVFPYWDDAADCVKWTDEAVPPDGSLSHLLTTPKDAVKHFFGRDLRPAGVSWLDWNNHLFSVHAIVAELCVERMRPTSLLDIMNEFVRSRLVADDVSDRLASLASLAISSQPVYKFTCAACQAFQRLKQSEVDWFTSRRLELPKTCKSCRSKNGRRRHKGRT